MTPIIDTHQHLVMARRWPYSWTSGIPALAGRVFDVDENAAASAGTGIAYTIFMETTPDDSHWRDEARIACAMGDDPSSPVVGAIIDCRPEQVERIEAFLDASAHSRLVGLRRILHVAPDELSHSPHFRANLRLLARRNPTFDLCVLARQLPIALELARACPDVRFVFDHCGVPAIADQQFDPWREHLRELAACDNVVCKISGVIACCAPGRATLETVRPYVEHAIECFGWNRVVRGWRLAGGHDHLEPRRLGRSLAYARRGRGFRRSSETLFRQRRFHLPAAALSLLSAHVPLRKPPRH